MNVEFLERLYWNAAAEKSRPCEEINLSGLYKRMPDVERKNDAFNKLLFGAGIPFTAADTVSDCHADVCLAYEKQGFVNGVRLEMMLARELRIGDVV